MVLDAELVGNPDEELTRYSGPRAVELPRRITEKWSPF